MSSITGGLWTWGEDKDGEQAGEQADDVYLLPSIADKDDGIYCGLDVRYPILKAILSGNNHQVQVGSILCIL